MLTSDALIPLVDPERQQFLDVVPADHFLRRVLAVVDFEAFRPILEAAYTGFGRPPLDAVFLFKLELLARPYRYSDREILGAVRFNIAYRLFLQISLNSPLPHPTVLTYFRQRQGPERLQEIFDQVVAQARQLGLVKDRLRLKDATHILANIAIPSTLRLVAETRDQLLEAVRPWASARVAEAEQHAEAIRVATEEATDTERLVRRVTHLRTILAWAEEIPTQETFRQAAAPAQQALRSALALAHKVLADRDDPEAGDKRRSLQDPDARCGMHGGYDDGYLLDVAMDADSEILTAVNVLPANGDEGMDAVQLITQEEQAHGHDVQAVSLDGAGYRGEVRHTLTDPEGLDLEVFVPPTERIPLTVFGPEQFTLGEDGESLTCPAGQTTSPWERSRHDTGRKYRFAKKQCGGCALRDRCLATPEVNSRRVTKNDYEADYRAAQAKAETPAYRARRREHPAIERKLSELVNRHGARRARYRGQRKVRWQSLLIGVVVNLKRLVRLLDLSGGAVGTVRAEVVGVS